MLVRLRQVLGTVWAVSRSGVASVQRPKDYAWRAEPGYRFAHPGYAYCELCIVWHRFHRRDPRCIWATRFGKVMTRSFVVLHEAIVSRQSILSCAGCAACCATCLTLEPNGGRRASGETAAVCAGAVVRNGHHRRLVRC